MFPDPVCPTSHTANGRFPATFFVEGAPPGENGPVAAGPCLSYGWEHGEPAPDLPRICIFPGSRSPTGKWIPVVKSPSATRFPAFVGAGIAPRFGRDAIPRLRVRGLPWEIRPANQCRQHLLAHQHHAPLGIDRDAPRAAHPRVPDPVDSPPCNPLRRLSRSLLDAGGRNVHLARESGHGHGGSEPHPVVGRNRSHPLSCSRFPERCLHSQG